MKRFVQPAQNTSTVYRKRVEKRWRGVARLWDVERTLFCLSRSLVHPFPLFSLKTCFYV
jgi:hypothetical protein